jgi:hypothetical protein
MFLRLLLRDLYGPSHILTILETGLKNSTIQIKARYDDSNLLAKLPRHLGGFVKNWLKLYGDDAPSKLALRLPIGETFYVRRTALVAHFCRAKRWFLITDF